MIIDFRVQPPFRSFRALPIARGSREQLLRRNGARLLGLEPS